MGILNAIINFILGFVKWSFIIIVFLLLSWGDIIFGLIVGGIIFYAVIRFIINDSERKYG
jgi:multisubunit Na+/H+ antiporter MnhE subunit